MPEADLASPEDVTLVRLEVISGLMEWAYHEPDRHGVKTAAYAHYILDSFFDGFSGDKMNMSAEKSKIYALHSMLNCLKRYRG